MKWGIGAKIWFVFYTLCQWVAFIEYATRRYVDSQLLWTSGLTGLVGTVLILWLAISHKRAALITMLVIVGVNALALLVTSGFGSAVASLIFPAITWLIARHHVE